MRRIISFCLVLLLFATVSFAQQEADAFRNALVGEWLTTESIDLISDRSSDGAEEWLHSATWFRHVQGLHIYHPNGALEVGSLSRGVGNHPEFSWSIVTVGESSVVVKEVYDDPSVPADRRVRYRTFSRSLHPTQIEVLTRVRIPNGHVSIEIWRRVRSFSGTIEDS